MPYEYFSKMSSTQARDAVVQYLCEHGADTKVKNEDGQDVLEIAKDHQKRAQLHHVSDLYYDNLPAPEVKTRFDSLVDILSTCKKTTSVTGGAAGADVLKLEARVAELEGTVAELKAAEKACKQELGELRDVSDDAPDTLAALAPGTSDDAPDTLAALAPGTAASADKQNLLCFSSHDGGRPKTTRGGKTVYVGRVCSDARADPTDLHKRAFCGRRSELVAVDAITRPQVRVQVHKGGLMFWVQILDLMKFRATLSRRPVFCQQLAN